MSNEKLSELSKPAGFVSKQAQTLLNSGETASIRPFFDVQGSSPLYSQGYVSALLQRIASQDDHINQQQDRIESLEKKNGDLGKALGAAEKRLVHIKDACDAWERKAISNFEECATMSQRIDELEKRLATPVRLPESYSAEPWVSPDPDGTLLDKWDVKEAIRAAGFTVGDE